MASRPVVGLMLATAASPDTGQTEPARVIEAARRAEAAGFDGVYAGDHLLHPHPLLESVVTLAAVAASTDRISLGPCVMLLALRHPVVLAKQLGTLSAFAPGRLRVGVGVGGEYPAEFEAAGVPLSERGRRMESALRQVRSLLTDGARHPEVTIAPGAPDVPFLLAGRKEVSLRRAATYGDGWIGYLLGLDSFARRRAFVRRCREEVVWEGQLSGMDPEEIRKGYVKYTPLGRLCEPEDVADVIMFLSSDKARFMTGQAVNVTGGLIMH